MQGVHALHAQHGFRCAHLDSKLGVDSITCRLILATSNHGHARPAVLAQASIPACQSDMRCRDLDLQDLADAFLESPEPGANVLLPLPALLGHSSLPQFLQHVMQLLTCHQPAAAHASALLPHGSSAVKHTPHAATVSATCLSYGRHSCRAAANLEGCLLPYIIPLQSTPCHLLCLASCLRL